MTMLMVNYFPTFNTTFCPNAVAHAMGPESWHILFRKGVDGFTPLFINLASWSSFPSRLDSSVF